MPTVADSQVWPAVPYADASFGAHEGAVSIVTGAGSSGDAIGIGRAVALQLAHSGSRVVVVDRDEARARSTQDWIEAEGGVALAVAADVTKLSDCARVVDRALETYQRVDVLVNNVGGVGAAGTAVDVDPGEWDEGLRLNVTSMMAMVRSAVPAMTAQGAGSVINISSVSGIRGGHPNVLYPTTKAAVVGMTRAMAVHHGRAGVRVNCVAPGMLHSPMVEERGVDAALRHERAQANLLGVEGDVWDVAAAVTFLAGPAAKWITGVVLPVDAGLSAGDAKKPSPR